MMPSVMVRGTWRFTCLRTMLRDAGTNYSRITTQQDGEDAVFTARSSRMCATREYEGKPSRPHAALARSVEAQLPSLFGHEAGIILTGSASHGSAAQRFQVLNCET
jgi:hypothetical protein